jgi:hypothetical protein
MAHCIRAQQLRRLFGWHTACITEAERLRALSSLRFDFYVLTTMLNIPLSHLECRRA